MKNAGEFFMRYVINSTSTRTQGWQADCWNWARTGEPFEIYGFEPEHLAICRKLSAACGCKYRFRQIHGEKVVVFEPLLCHV